MSEIGRGLAGLLVERVRVPDPVLPAALAARNEVRALLEVLAYDGALGRKAATADLSELVRNPTGTFNRLRQATPVIDNPGAHDLLAASGRTAVEAAWLGVHRHAIVAGHEWATADRASRPRGAAAWSLVADGAAIATATLHLEVDVEAALRRAGRTGDADRLEQARTSGLDRAIREVMLLARSGDLPDPPPLRRPGVPNPVAVYTPALQREGGRRLVAQLDAEQLSPRAMRAVLTEHARTLMTAGAILGDGGLSDGLSDLAREVMVAARRLQATASVEPTGRRAVIQAQQLHAFIASERHRDPRPEVAIEAAHQAHATLSALVRRATADVSAGRWLVADGERHDGPLWVTADMGDHKPDVLTRLAHARTTAAPISHGTTPDPATTHPSGPRLVPPRESLDAVSAEVFRPRRPQDPGARLAAVKVRDVERSVPR